MNLAKLTWIVGNTPLSNRRGRRFEHHLGGLRVVVKLPRRQRLPKSWKKSLEGRPGGSKTGRAKSGLTSVVEERESQRAWGREENCETYGERGVRLPVTPPPKTHVTLNLRLVLGDLAAKHGKADTKHINLGGL